MTEVWQSDLSLKVDQKRTQSRNHYNVKIHTHNDDMSRSPHLIFSLPRNSVVKEIAFSEGFERTAYQIYGSSAQAGSADRIDGYVKFDFENLNSQSLEVKISITEVGEGWEKDDGASAFVFSLTPEYQKENNFVYLPLN